MAFPTTGNWSLKQAGSGTLANWPHLQQDSRRKPGNMSKRFASIWFPTLKTDWCTRKQPGLKCVPFVLVSPDHGRLVVTGANELAQREGVILGMVLADARAVIPSLQVLD